MTRLLTADQLASCQPWLDSQRHLRTLVTELETLSLAVSTPTPAGNAKPSKTPL